MPILLEVLTMEDLHDFVDGRADGEATEAILDLMSEDPVVSQIVYDYRRQALALREAFAVEADDRTAERLADLLFTACSDREDSPLAAHLE